MSQVGRRVGRETKEIEQSSVILSLLKWMGSGLFAGGKITDERSLYPLDGTAGTCSER